MAEATVQSLTDLGGYIAAALSDAVTGRDVTYGELNVDVIPSQIVRVVKFLRDDPRSKFTQLIDICGVDYPERSPRFNVVYHLLSLHNNQRIRLRVAAEDSVPVPSIIEIHPCSNWFERETFDMYGILFSGHPDLRRLLTDYGFSGYPLRKDFPLTGFVEVRYDDVEKRVIYEPVKLVQEFRVFDFLSPWEGAKYILPGDEKAGEAKK
jgi:NADH-quinone oxidoreductase subunit C